MKGSDFINNIILITGGLSLFLFGLNYMRQSLLNINSDRIKCFIKKATNSKIKALFTGVIMTTIIQSSSGVTAIVVALISTNLLSFAQGIMIMIGANIGTTTTAFIFTLNIENYSLVFIFIGMILYYFKNNKIHYIGDILIGFGILFFGIYIMKQAFIKISNSPVFLYITLMVSKNWFYSILGGTLLSAAIQSSSATIGIVQNLYMLQAIPLKSAISLMLGANIGTTIASLIASISATIEAKQAVYVNIIFNIIGGFIFLVILIPFCNILELLENNQLIIPNKKFTIAYSHLIFNIISTISFYLIFDYIIKTVQKINRKHIKKQIDTNVLIW